MSTGVREQYYHFFNENGVKYPASGNLTKPVIGTLSPGCQTCIAGTWSCIFITGGCTKHCFYCPSADSHSSPNRKPTVSKNLSFTSVQDYIAYLKMFDFRGISFSGGEPLLAMDRVLEYMNGIKQFFGDKHYIWLYTNGDLITAQKLSLLQEAGLNEIRFDIASSGYDLSPVAKAVEFIDTVSVEIPAIPEDSDKLKSILKEMEEIGVKHLNLHQLMKTDHNSEQLNQRGYSPVNEKLYPENAPILESELAALDILKYAIETKSGLGVNYCSRCYKARFQGQANRKRAALICKDKRPDLTDIGYLRKVAIDASTPQAAMIKHHLSENEYEMTDDGDVSKLVLSSDNFDLLLTENYHGVDVIYYVPLFAPVDSETLAQEPHETMGENTICFKTSENFRTTLDNPTSAFLFNRLFIEKIDIELVISELLLVYGLNDDNGGELIQDTKEFYKRFEDVEYMSQNLEPYE